MRSRPGKDGKGRAGRDSFNRNLSAGRDRFNRKTALLRDSFNRLSRGSGTALIGISVRLKSRSNLKDYFVHLQHMNGYPDGRGDRIGMAGILEIAQRTPAPARCVPVRATQERKGRAAWRRWRTRHSGLCGPPSQAHLRMCAIQCIPSVAPVSGMTGQGAATAPLPCLPSENKVLDISAVLR